MSGVRLALRCLVVLSVLDLIGAVAVTVAGHGSPVIRFAIFVNAFFLAINWLLRKGRR